MSTIVFKAAGAAGGALAARVVASTAKSAMMRQAAGHRPRIANAERRRSLDKASAISARARARFVYLALIKHLSAKLFCIHGRSSILGTGDWTNWWFPAHRRPA
jgi:hypothetical protein